VEKVAFRIVTFVTTVGLEALVTLILSLSERAVRLLLSQRA
jgi:hypothetical protein